MSLTQLHHTAERLRSTIAKLNFDKSKLSQKRASLIEKINKANTAAAKSRNQSTNRSKIQESERAGKSLVQVDREIAQIDGKIARHSKMLGNVEKSLAKQQATESAKRELMQKRKNAATESSIVQLDSELSSIAQDVESLKNLPQVISVLFLASNPIEESALRLDEEVRLIHEMIRRSDNRDSVRLESRWAVRPLDVLLAMNEVDPTIVHFSGHGTSHGEIIFQNDNGGSSTVTIEAMVQTMKATSDRIRLVFFNLCNSKALAQAVVTHVEAAIGMKGEIADDAARYFAAQVYSAIGFGKSLYQAFEQGRASLMLTGSEQEDIPELYVADGVDVMKLVILQPT